MCLFTLKRNGVIGDRKTKDRSVALCPYNFCLQLMLRRSPIPIMAEIMDEPP